MEWHKRFLLGIGLTFLALIIGFGFWYFNTGMFSNIIFSNKATEPREDRRAKEFNNPFKLEIKVKGSSDAKVNHLPENLIIERPKMVESMPFSPQAPFGEWDNPIYQDGCEEAAVLMSIKWARGEGMSFESAAQEIRKMALWQEKEYGYYQDTSVDDTVERIIKGYFGYDKVEIKKDVVLDDITGELKKGRVVIVPTDGQLLGNPYYTPPGPERHNLVIYAYDEDTDEFIVNDPGTKRGEGYRYGADTLYMAIRDYPSGYHESILKIEKNVIIIYKLD